MFSTFIDGELEGYQIILDYEEGESNQKIAMDFLKLSAGEDIERVFMQEESVWVILTGNVEWEISEDSKGIMKRKSVFDGKPEAVYLPPEVIIKFKASADSEVAIFRSRTDVMHHALFIPKDSIVEKDSGENGWKHKTREIITEKTPVSNLFVGEIVLEPQKWAEFPPVAYEKSESIFLFKTDKDGGMGLFYSFSGEQFDEKKAAVIENGSVIFTDGYHTFTAAPKCNLYALCGISTPNRKLEKKIEERQSLSLSV